MVKKEREGREVKKGIDMKEEMDVIVIKIMIRGS